MSPSAKRSRPISSMRSTSVAGHGWLLIGVQEGWLLAAALHQFGGDDALADVFRLKCGGRHVRSVDDGSWRRNLACRFQEFLAAVAVLPFAAIIFDDLSASISSGDQPAEFEKKCPIFDFCPQLQLICITRIPPKEVDPAELVVLRPLDIPEVRAFLRTHPKAKAGLDEPDQLERITIGLVASRCISIDCLSGLNI